MCIYGGVYEVVQERGAEEREKRGTETPRTHMQTPHAACLLHEDCVFKREKGRGGGRGRGREGAIETSEREERAR